jgi:aryl-alcohol dehydrogenase-like predicted oxidoreductase
MARLAGRATAEGTRRYGERFAGRLPDEHFRRLDGDLRASSLGIGTYLGQDDASTDTLYRGAVGRALELGINVIDTAVNYRHQRSERAIGAALAAAVEAGGLARNEVVVATKGGFIPFDGAVPRDPGAYFTATYLDTGIVGPGDLVAGSHCMTPHYLTDQLERSRANLGLETLDVYYVHNPESQLEAVGAGQIARYGTATWNGYRQDPGAPGSLSLEELVTAAREVGGPDHHFKVIQLPYNLAMPEACTRGNQKVGGEMVSTLEAARRLGIYVMASASVYQGQLARNLPPVIAEFLPGLATDAQRALQFVRSTPGIGTALVGMKSAAHVEENAGVATSPPVPWDQFKRLFSDAS